MLLHRKFIIEQYTEVAHNSGRFYDGGTKLERQVFVVDVLKRVS